METQGEKEVWAVDSVECADRQVGQEPEIQAAAGLAGPVESSGRVPVIKIVAEPAVVAVGQQV